MEETATSTAEHKSELLLIDYFVSMEWHKVNFMALNLALRDTFGRK